MFWKKINSSAVELLEMYEEILGNKCLSHSKKLGIISKKLEKNWQNKIINEATFILSIAKGKAALRNTIYEIKKAKTSDEKDDVDFKYQISSLFIKDCWEYLKSDPQQNERLHFITGTVTKDGTRVLSRIEKIKYNSQSPAYVSADSMDSHKKLIDLTENNGHLLLGLFHSHMSRGSSSTMPSSVDDSFMARMEKVGCHCLGGIFSLDGYVRFFMPTTEFEIDVYGKGVDKVKDLPSCKIYRINEGIKDERKKI